MKDIFENGKVLKDSKEKDFYWLYFTNNDEPWKYQYINHEQILVQLIAEEEQNELGENDIYIFLGVLIFLEWTPKLEKFEFLLKKNVSLKFEFSSFGIPSKNWASSYNYSK